MKRLVIEGLCDICGKAAPSAEAGEHTLVVDGAGYIIDLCDEHSHALAEALAPFLANVARSGLAQAKLPRPGRLRKGGAVPRDEARRWARERGFEVAATGRLSPEIVAAYLAAQRAEAVREEPEGQRLNGHTRAAYLSKGPELGS